MKNKKKFFIMGIFFVVVIAGILFKYFQYINSLEGKISTHCNSYKEYWKLDYVNVNENINEINIAISAKKKKTTPNEYVSKTPIVCNKITDYLFSDQFEYCKSEYYLNFHFYYGHDDFHVENIYPDRGDISVRFSTYDVALKDLAEWYPETEKLTIYGGDFQLEDLAGFKNLRRLRITNGITQEEKERILSICPDVNLLDTKIKEN